MTTLGRSGQNSSAALPDQSSAYEQARRTLLANPLSVAAWLQMSRLVEDAAKQRECLERALALDPDCHAAREGLEHLRLREILSSARSIVAAPEQSQQRRKLGEYLVEQGWVTQARLETALAEQRRRQTGIRRSALGEVLIELGWLTPRQLAKALIWQQQEQFNGQPLPVPERLGDYLVLHGVITAEQLERVLAVQAELRQLGQATRLGEILIRCGYVTTSILDQMLERQRQDFYSAFS